MIKASDVKKAYQGVPVLNGASFSIEPGNIVALLGENGSGKSTLLRCLAALENLDGGIITYEGEIYNSDTIYGKENPIHSIWPNITLVFQQLYLWPHLTVRKNISVPLKQRFPSSWKERLERTVDEFELEAFQNRYPNQISVGQKQKAALARAISLDPNVLLLDEITAALDNSQATKVANILKKERDNGKIIIVVSHSINYAIHLSDQYMVLESGLITEINQIDKISESKTNFLFKSKTRGGFIL